MKWVVGIIVVVMLFLSGCADVKIEEQEPRIIDTTINSNVIKEPIVEPGKNVTTNEGDTPKDPEDIFKEANQAPRTFSVQLQNLNETSPVLKTVSLGDIIDVYLGKDIVGKITVSDISSGKFALLSLDNRQAKKYEKDEIIELDEPFYVAVSDILYNEEGEKYVSMLQLTFFMEIKEKYPTYLVEKDIGLHTYIESRKEDEKYTARYNDVTVTVEEGKEFTSRYTDNDNVIDYNDFKIYKFPHKEGVAWMSARENVPYLITINKNTESIIDTYLGLFPSMITSKTFCQESITLDELEERIFLYKDQSIKINAAAILDSTVEVKLIINNDISKRLGPKDSTMIGDIILLIDKIDINYDGNKDRVKICFI